jgi:hypothetical protein
VYAVGAIHIRQVFRTRLDLLGPDDKELVAFLESIRDEILKEETFVNTTDESR